MTTQISKIQLRRGLQNDLPGANGVALDIAEVAFTTDSNRMFIGSDPTNANTIAAVHNAQEASSNAFPFKNVEVLTEFSPKNQKIFDAQSKNITTAFISSEPWILTGDNSWGIILTRTMSSTGNSSVSSFNIDAQSLVGNFGTAKIHYHIIDFSTGAPMKNGTLTVFHQGATFQPMVSDEAVANAFAGYSTSNNPNDPNLRYGAIRFRAIAISTGIALQYQISYATSNGDLPIPVMYFRVEQPYIIDSIPLQTSNVTSNAINIANTINVLDAGFF